MLQNDAEENISVKFCDLFYKYFGGFMKKILSVLICGNLWLVGLCFASGPGTTAASFLKIGVGAKNIAMGETGATSDDVNSIYWNPAGISKLTRPEISVMHCMWFQDINYEHLSIAYPSKLGTFGFAANYLSMGAIEKYDVNDVSLNETYSPSDMAGTVSYAREL